MKGGKLKRVLVPVLCASLVACGQVAGNATAQFDPRIGQLSAEVMAKNADIADLAARVNKLEAASAEQAIALANLATESKSGPEAGAPWVAWLKELPVSPQLGMGYKPDTPVGAFPARSQCVDAIRAATMQNGGDPDQVRYVTNNGRYDQVNTYACLPDGTDPRIKR